MTIRFSVLLYVITAISSFLLIVYVTDNNIEARHRSEVAQDINIDLKEVETLVKKEYQNFTNDLRFLHNTPPINSLASAANQNVNPLDNTTTAQWKDRLAQIFTSFMENNRAYNQFRVLDSQGQEVVRVDNVAGNVKRVAGKDLQNKSHRFYFTHSKQLKKGGIYTSRIDLNQENGELVFPLTPMLRLAQPIFNDNNQLFGVFVMNIDATALQSAVDKIVTNKYDLFIADSDGYFLKHFDEALQYSRDLNPEKTLTSVYSNWTNYGDGLSQVTFNGEGNDERFLGVKKTFSVAASSEGGKLTAGVLLPEARYASKLQTRRAESWLGLAGFLLVSAIVVYFLYRNNVRLTKLLIRSEESEAAVDVAEDAIVIIDNKWNINSANYAFEHLFSLRAPDITNKSLPEIMQHLGDNSFTAITTSDKNELEYTGYNWVHMPKHGVVKHLYSKLSKIKTSRSDAAYALVISDVTAEKEALEAVEHINTRLEHTIEERTRELIKAAEKANEASKVKTTFISTISHEMRTPLNGIVGATTLLKKEPLSEKQVTMLQMAENSVDSLRALINDVLDLSKIEAGKLEFNFQYFNPEALIESVTSTMSVVAKDKQLDFYVDTNDLSLSQIYCDPHRLTQVMNNLLNNAVKFTHQGSISLKAWSTIHEETAILHIEVQDTGIGIAKEKQDKLFQSFSQADSSISGEYGGTGLGLSICKEILSLLNGEITVRSTESNGSCFSFTLPLQKWESKNNDLDPRLQGVKVGLLTKHAPLAHCVTRIVESNGARATALSMPLSREAIQSYSLIVVDSRHPQSESVKRFWNAMPDDEVSATQLAVISNVPEDHNVLPQGAISLVTPVYRSVFLSLLFNDRQKDAAPQQMSNHRRSSDSASTSEQATSLPKCKILVVDDNDINAQVAKFILEPLGAQITVVVNGQQAIQALTESVTSYDLILMDCNMPVLDGYEATRAIRAGTAGEQYQSIHIIASTANAMKGECDKCYEAGMNDYITKPVDADLLIKKVSAHLTSTSQTQPQALTLPLNEQKAVDYHNGIAEQLWDKETALLRLSGREALQVQLLQMFINSAESKMQAITNSFASKDRGQIRLDAHALKGNCGDIGAVALHSTLMSLENQAEVAEFMVLEELLATTRTQLSHTLLLFRKYLAKDNAPQTSLSNGND